MLLPRKWFNALKTTDPTIKKRNTPKIIGPTGYSDYFFDFVGIFPFF